MTDDTRALAVKQRPVTGTYQEPGSFIPSCDVPGCVMCQSFFGERPQQNVTPYRNGTVAS